MEKNLITKTVSLVVVLAMLSLSVCSCSLINNIPLKKQVKEYCQDKYGFTPKVTDIKRNRDLWGAPASYNIIANDGNKDFEVFVTKEGEITDSYETDIIDDALSEWAASYVPGTVYAHLMFGRYGADEKFTGDIVTFLKDHGEPNRFTFAYVDHSFKTKDDAWFLSELYDLELIVDCFLLNCPDEESAKVVYDKFTPSNIDPEYYSPYVTDSLVIDYQGEAEYNCHDLEEADGIKYCWIDYPSHVYINEPACSSVKRSSDCSLSDICPTFEVEGHMSEDDRRVMVVFIPLDMIDGDLKISFTDSIGLSSLVVRNDKYGINGTMDFSYGVFGDYAVADINIHNGMNYFAIVRPS